MKKYKMLFAGESWLTHNMEVKGWDDFSVGGYGTEIDRIHAAMDEFAEITHLPSHLVGEKFPSTMEELKTYDVVILSDVGPIPCCSTPWCLPKASVSPTAYSSWRTM